MKTYLENEDQNPEMLVIKITNRHIVINLQSKFADRKATLKKLPAKSLKCYKEILQIPHRLPWHNTGLHSKGTRQT